DPGERGAGGVSLGDGAEAGAAGTGARGTCCPTILNDAPTASSVQLRKRFWRENGGGVRDRIRLLSLVVTATVLLLAGSAVLAVLGIFNGSLHWDIFSPEVEKVLYGLFGSCVALAAFGVATSFVLGIQEVVLAFRRLAERAGPEAPAAVPAPQKTSLRFYP